MPEFDPEKFAPFKPATFCYLHEAATVMLRAIQEAKERSVARLASDTQYDDARKSAALEAYKDSYEINDEKDSQSAWNVLREVLVTGRVKAICIDHNANIIPVTRGYWLTEHVKNTFSTGLIEKIPLYDPNGVVFIDNEDIIQMHGTYMSILIDEMSPKNIIGRHEGQILSPNAIADRKEIGDARINREIFDKDVFYMELVYEYTNNGFPESKRGAQKAYRQKLIDAYVAAGGPGGAPSHDWVKKRLLPIQRRLRVPEEDVAEDIARLEPPAR